MELNENCEVSDERSKVEIDDESRSEVMNENDIEEKEVLSFSSDQK